MIVRLKSIVKPIAVILVIGFIYTVIHYTTGFSLFCPFNRFLGVYCPGCGISRMFFNLFEFDFLSAFKSNCVLFCVLPVLFVFFIWHSYRYVRYGKRGISKWENRALYFLIAVLIIFAVVRNIYPADFLVP